MRNTLDGLRAFRQHAGCYQDGRNRIGVESVKWVFLAVAIVTEVVATSALKASMGFTRLIPSIVVLVGYAASFYFMSLTLDTIPVGVAYAVWSGVGLTLISLIGYFVFGQSLDMPAVAGIVLIGAGVIVISAFSQSAAH
jgi:small multidrug resistance pump